MWFYSVSIRSFLPLILTMNDYYQSFLDTLVHFYKYDEWASHGYFLASSIPWQISIHSSGFQAARRDHHWRCNASSFTFIIRLECQDSRLSSWPRYVISTEINLFVKLPFPRLCSLFLSERIFFTSETNIVTWKKKHSWPWKRYSHIHYLHMHYHSCLAERYFSHRHNS